MKLLCSIAPVSIVLASTIAAAPPRPGAVLDDLAATRAFEEIAITPDGQRVAWVEKVIDKGRDTGRAAVFAAALDGKRPPVRLREGRHIAWSHDGARLAFVDKQLYVAAFPAPAKKLTSLAGYVTDPAWSLDAARIAILFVEHAAAGGGPGEAEPGQGGGEG